MSRSPQPILAVIALGAALATLTSCAGDSGKTPWKDPAAQGTITLYDQAGKAETKGKTTTHPFAARAVESETAPVAYAVSGRTATLLAYQPRQGADPTEWSGDLLTASTPYQGSHPTVTAKTSDFSLQDFLAEYPPKWKGMIQLRLFLGAPGQVTRTTPYATATIKVNGDSWSLVGG